MSIVGQPRSVGEIKNPVVRMRVRQFALFLAMLLSGGLLVIPRAPMIVMLILLSIALVSPAKWVRRDFMLIYFVLVATLVMALIGGQSFQVDAMIVRYANFFGGFALLAMYYGESRSTITNDLYGLLKLMCFQSILTPPLAIALSEFFIPFESGELTYNTLGYVFTYHDAILNAPPIKRPDGFFFEPGVFQIYLNMFLFICLFVRQRSWFDIGLAALAVIATQSTTGAVILVLQFSGFYMRWLKTASRQQKVGVFVFVPVLLLPLAAYMTYNVSEKFYGVLSGSAEAREYDLRTGLRVVMENPLTGIGFDYEKYFDASTEVGYADVNLSRENLIDRGNTNGIVVLLFSVGVPLSLLFLFGLFFQRMFRPGWLMGGILFLSLLAELLFFTPIFLMVTFSGLLIAPQQGARTFSRGAPMRPAGQPQRV